MISSALIGVGSHHGDDRLGWLALDLLQRKYTDKPELRFIKCEYSVMDWWGLVAGVKQWLFIDAIVSNSPPGQIYCFEIRPGCEIDNFQGLSSHGISLLDAIRLADTVGSLPERVLVWGIEIEHNRFGMATSSSVSHAVPKLVDSLGYFLEYDQLLLPEQELLV